MKPVFIGYTEGQERLTLTARDLETHVHGIGGTRTGKSKLVEWIARELIRGRQGFCLIDPHGFLYEDLVRWLTYLKPKRKIVLFDPSSQGRVVGFNPFVRGSGDLGARVNRLIRATVKAWGAEGTDETPRVERWLRCIYHTMLEGGYTLPAVQYLLQFATKDERAYLTSKVTSDLIRNEWDELESYKRAQDFSGQVESSRSRLFRFLASEPIQRIVGLADNNLDVEEIIEDGQILLVNLQPSDVLTEESSRLLGTLLLNEIWEVGMRRRRTGGKTPQSFYLIVDEFQKFLTPDISDMLDQAAKYGIHLMLFHQRLDQLRRRDEEAYSAVMTNARTKLVFGALSREDARIMADQIYPGQVDLKRVKHVIEQTKFWPVYGRDTVRSSSRGSTSSATRTAGKTWNPEFEEWVPNEGATDADGDSWQEGESDIPVFFPEAFREETGVQFYSLEEVLREMTDRLMEQYQRHFMIRRPGERTMAAVTPFVREWRVTDERSQRYVESVLQRYLSVTDVDLLLKEGQTKLLTEARESSEPAIESGSWGLAPGQKASEGKKRARRRPPEGKKGNP